LRAGAGFLGGLTLADLLRAEAQAGRGSSAKAVINIHLDGGPPQMDMIDLKPEAPVEIRGEFRGIDTRLPGFRICELMPKLASIADRFAFIRSLVGAVSAHNAFQCMSGFSEKDLASLGGRPALGSIIAKLRGSLSDTAPSFVDLMQGRALVRNSARPGFLGPAYQPFRPDISQMFQRELEKGMMAELARRGDNHTTKLSLIDELSAARLQDRTSLLAGLDTLRRDLDSSGMMDAMDGFTQQAVGILTSGTFAAAMDFNNEDPRTLEHYLGDADNIEAAGTSDGGNAVLKLLLARRLIEAGVRVVSISLSDYDTHSGNFSRLRRLLPTLDQGLYALVTDLEQRGMLDDVTIVAWGEFGRTPKVNKNAGRDHWPSVGMAMMAGGGLRTGQVIGSTDRHAATATSRPVHYQDVLATVYHNLGIDLRSTTIVDPSGRPQYLLDRGMAIDELV
jgi:hypothetical protein